MVEDTHNKTYTELSTYMKTLYPALNCGTEYEIESNLPYLYFYQMDAPTKDTTLSNTEESVMVSYQIEIYTNTGMNDARKMSNDVRSYMIAQGFKCRTFRPIQSPSNVSRFVARYERLEV